MAGDRLGATLQAQRLGDVTDIVPLAPRAFELTAPWGPVVRGVRWGDRDDVVLLLHEPGADIDAWGTLPSRLVDALGIQTVAVDLPGHGLSDEPWEPHRSVDLVRLLAESEGLAGRLVSIAAGSMAFATLEIAAEVGLAGLVCLSPEGDRRSAMPRSPRVPKLLFAGAQTGDDLATARHLATATGGWAVVTSIPAAAQGTVLLASEWSGRITEEITAFLRDCQGRPARSPGSAASIGVGRQG